MRAKIRMGDVWDRTTEILSGRAAMLAGLAAIGIFAPGVVRDALVAFGGTGMATALIGMVVSIMVMVATIWTQLGVLAIASDPATTAATARVRATARLGAAVGVFVAIGALFLVLILPVIGALVAAHVDLAGMRSGAMPDMTPGLAGFLALYTIAFGLGALWLGARLILVHPVVLHERRGLGAIRRSFALTRGLTLRLIGVMILFVIVVGIASMAVGMVAGLIFRLILGGEAAATVQFLANVATLVVTTGFTVVASVFSAQLYRAVAVSSDPESQSAPA